MKAAKLTEHPSFRLMRQTDVQNVWHMQMPRWLFSDPRYADMSLDAKVTYTFLLNRFQLSRRNGWVNDAGEVFVIFPRKALAKELRICEQRVTAAFRKLAELQLIWENAVGAATPIRSIWPASRPSTIPTTNVHRFHQGSMNPAVPEPRMLHFLMRKNRRSCRPRTPEFPLLEPKILMFQNRRIRAQVILILVNLIQLSQMSVCLYPRRTDRRTMKKSSRAFWMLVSFRISSRRWRVFLKMPSSGCFTRTTCASGRLFCRKAGCGHGCTG